MCLERKRAKNGKTVWSYSTVQGRRETDALMEPPPPPRGPPDAERHALWHGRERN